MDSPSYGDGEPIAALATALAESALSIIRTSGTGSIELASERFSRPAALRSAPGNTLLHGWLLDEKGARVDEVVASVFRAPHSFSGEDGVEFTCHGGVATVQAVLTLLKRSGFRQALPGEFSLRAFLNGKLDLTRAEAIMELVSAKTETAREHSVSRLSGALCDEIQAVKDELVTVLAAAELYLDYSEDDGVGSDEAEGLLPDRARAESALDSLRALQVGYRVEKLYQEGATVAVAGRPNAGKSSLFNRLSKEERSIVSDIPGTTRDWIETWIAVEGLPIRLVDTAGLRESDDPIEKTGVERSFALLAEAETVLYLVDGTRGLTEEDQTFLSGLGGKPVLLVWNKADKAPPAPEGFLSISAKTGAGVHELCLALSQALLEKYRQGGAENGSAAVKASLASARQKELVDRAAGAIEEALALDSSRRPLDLTAMELHRAVDALGEITGEVTPDDLLEAMFSRFCVGK